MQTQAPSFLSQQTLNDWRRRCRRTRYNLFYNQLYLSVSASISLISNEHFHSRSQISICYSNFANSNSNSVANALICSLRWNQPQRQTIDEVNYYFTINSKPFSAGNIETLRRRRFSLNCPCNHWEVWCVPWAALMNRSTNKRNKPMTASQHQVDQWWMKPSRHQHFSQCFL